MAEMAGLRLRDRWARLARRAVHEREPRARVGVGEAEIAAQRGAVAAPAADRRR